MPINMIFTIFLTFYLSVALTLFIAACILIKAGYDVTTSELEQKPQEELLAIEKFYLNHPVAREFVTSMLWVPGILIHFLIWTLEQIEAQDDQEQESFPDELE